MADVLAAVGLAASILQFIETGITCVRVAYDLYKSPERLAEGDRELEMLTSDIKVTLQRIQANSQIPISDDLRDLTSTCDKLAKELQEILKGLRIDPAKDRRVEAVKKTLKAYMKRQEIKELSARIERIRVQICDHLNLEFMSSLVRTEISNISIQHRGQSKLQGLAAKGAQLSSERPWEKVHDDEFGEQMKSFKHLVTTVHDFTKWARFYKQSERVLKSLHFPEIKERQSDVQVAHSSTFGWVFEKGSSVNFAHWLGSSGNDGIYWIAGDPGSGKSTLMKFILNHQDTTTILNEWSDQTEVIKAAHFFWSAGTTVQKSQEGLFRTLLFQILLQRAELIPKLCPRRWSDRSFEHIETWTRTELFDTMKDLTRLLGPSCRVCIFVDGLDEYHGDREQLVDVLCEISKCPYVKIVVSSRPWIEFRKPFEMRPWKLYVQDLTENDILGYVTSKFKDVVITPPADEEEKWTSEDLTREICRKAQGVFLWVFLVTRSLLRGVANGDNMRDLRSRLHELPSDLEKYFGLMLNSIENVYRQRTARIFKSLVHVDTTLPIMTFYFFDREEIDPDYVTGQSKVVPVSDSKVLKIVNPKRHQIIAQCRDLVKLSADLHEPPMLRDRVGFLHRTVWDFLRTENMSRLLTERAGSNWDPRVSLSKSFLSMLKIIPPWWIKSKVIHLDRVRRFALGVVSYTHELEAMAHPAAEQLLDELKATAEALFPEEDGWEELLPGTNANCIEDIIARCGHHRYIKERISSCAEQRQAMLLRQALRPTISIHNDEGFTFSIDEDIDMVLLQQCLELHISPNINLVSHINSERLRENEQSNLRRTVWNNFIIELVKIKDVNLEISTKEKDKEPPSNASEPVTTEATLLKAPSNSFEACRMMLSYDADRILVINGHERNVIELLREWYPDEDLDTLEVCRMAPEEPVVSPKNMAARFEAMFRSMWHTR